MNTNEHGRELEMRPERPIEKTILVSGNALLSQTLSSQGGEGVAGMGLDWEIR